MYKSLRLSAVLCALLPLLAACASASGPTFDQMRATEAPVAQNMGRIYLYRGGKVWGAGLQPAVKINGVKVGEAVPGGYFYVDEAPGTYTVSITTEKEESVSVPVVAGQPVYVHIYVLPGVFVGHVVPEIMDPMKAATDIRTLSYDDGMKKAKTASQ
ncbi:MAG TPA: DUF2846 domain-containing protein [Rhizomicrobium sp.]|nr:DUF2846 domain-containing protein [Rhizomicrobium sp.]